MAYSFGTVTAEMAYKGHRIETKDEKTATKYAKKRGLWRPGTIVKPIKN